MLELFNCYDRGILFRCQNIFTIQQELANITTKRETDLDIARQYIELLYLTPDVSIISLCPLSPYFDCTDHLSNFAQGGLKMSLQTSQVFSWVFPSKKLNCYPSAFPVLMSKRILVVKVFSKKLFANQVSFLGSFLVVTWIKIYKKGRKLILKLLLGFGQTFLEMVRFFQNYPKGFRILDIFNDLKIELECKIKSKQS